MMKRVEFLRHRKEKTLRGFWEEVHKEWFTKWPLPEPSPVDIAEAVKLGKASSLVGEEVTREGRLVSQHQN